MCDKVLKIYEILLFPFVANAYLVIRSIDAEPKASNLDELLQLISSGSPAVQCCDAELGQEEVRQCVASKFCCPCAMYIQLLDLTFRYSQAPSLGEVLRASSLEARCRR